MDLIRLQGEDAARAAERRGQISAQLWGGVGNAIASGGQAIVQATDPKRQMESLQLQEAKTGIAEHDTFKKILKDTPPVSENGMQLYDLPALASKATAAGIDPSAYLEHYANVNNGFRNEYQARLGTVQAGAQGLMLAPDATLAKDFLDRLLANHTITDAVHGHLSDAIDADPSPANITRIATPFAGPQKPVMGKPGETPLNPITAQPIGPPLPDKPVVVPAGGNLVQPPAAGAGGASPVLFTSPAAPSTAGNEAAIRALYAKRESGAEMTPAETAAIAGYEKEKSFNDAPVTVKTMVNGKPVERVMTRAEALAAGQFPSQPAASVVIHNQNVAAPDLPAWALDDSRPTGPDANKLDPKVRMTPNGLFQAAQTYIATGQMTPLARGQDPASQATRAAVSSKVGAIVAASGMDEPALRAFYKSNASSLTQQQKMQDSVQGFMATADKNTELLKGTLEKIPDVGIPIFNQPLRSFAKNVSGDANLSKFSTYLQSVQNEYARIISQPNLAGQLTDSARKEAEVLLDPKATVPQILGSLEALQKEGNNRLISVGEQIQRIQKRMQGGPDAAAPAAPASAPLVPTLRFNPATGKIEPIKAGG